MRLSVIVTAPEGADIHGAAQAALDVQAKLPDNTVVLIFNGFPLLVMDHTLEQMLDVYERALKHYKPDECLDTDEIARWADDGGPV